MGKRRKLKRKIKDARHDVQRANQLIKQYVDFTERGEHIPKVLRPGYKAARKFVRRRKVAIKRWRSKRRKLAKRPADEQMEFLRSKIGVTESPAGSNRGPGIIDRCQNFILGWAGAAWCGCLAGYAAIKKGSAIIENKARLAYVPYIVADARAGRNGLHEVSLAHAKPGDFVCFDFGGDGVADHVGTFVALEGSQVRTRDGNTSSGSGGSESNGGGIFERVRSGSYVQCVARPER